MNILENIRLHYETLTNNDKQIADYILKYPKKFCRQDINHFINEMNISKSALIRFSKKLGYQGYSELRYELSRIIFVGNTEEQKEKTPTEIISQGYIECLIALKEEVKQSQIQTIAHKILTSNQIKLFGYNESSLPLTHLSIRATLLNLDLIVYQNRDYFNAQIKNMTPNDLIIIYSVKDNAKVYTKLIENIKAPVVLVTMNPEEFNINNIKYLVKLPNTSKSSAGLLDEQVLFYVFNEILLAQLMREKTILIEN